MKKEKQNSIKEKKEEDTFQCQCHEVHESLVEAVREQIKNEEELQNLASLFKVFGEMTRIKILRVLRQGEMCVCDLAATVEMSQSAVSHQLRVLKQARLVRGRREGKSVYYSLDDAHVEKILDMGLEHLRHA